MALTRITSTVLEANAVNAEKMANGSLTTRLYGIKSIPLSALSDEANTASAETRLDANINLLQTNLNVVHANVVAAQANIISANTAMAANAAANDFLTYTSLLSAINDTTNNTNIISANVEFVETRRNANLQGAVSTISNLNLTASRAVVSLANGKIGISDVTATEIGYLDGVTSAIQTQLGTGSTDTTALEARRVANIAGAVSTITTTDLTASRAMVSDGSGKVAILASVTSTELGYVDATSSIQTQLNAGVTKINQTTDNVNQTSTNVAAIVAGTTGFTGQVTMADDLVIQGNLTVLGDSVTANTINSVIQDRFLMLANSATGAPSADVGILMNRGNEGNAAIFYDESTKSFTMAETRDPDANVVISPTGLANLAVGTLKYNGADLNTAITDNRSGAISTVYKDNLTVSRALASDGSGKIIVSDVTSTELGYLDGVSSAIQTQLTAEVAVSTAIEARRVANIAGAVSTITTADLTASRAVVSDGSGKVAISDVTATEVGYLDGVSSAIQTQFNNTNASLDDNSTRIAATETKRVANIAGAVATITDLNLTASRAVVSLANGKVGVSDVTTTEIGYLDGVSSAIQTQLDTKGSTAGFQANDYITFQRLNANINIVSANVALGLKQLINVSASADGEGTGSNNFFVATPPGGNPVAINNVVVTLNGITQTKTTDYIYTPASGKVTFTDAAIPSGLTVQIVTLNPPA